MICKTEKRIINKFNHAQKLQHIENNHKLIEAFQKTIHTIFHIIILHFYNHHPDKF